MKLLLFAVLVLVLVIPVAIWLDIRHEVEEYNGGYCPCCDGEFSHIRDDEELGRVYKCFKCGYSVNVTYDQVDGGFKEMSER